MGGPEVVLSIAGAFMFGALLSFVVGVLITEEHVGRWIKDRYGDDL